MNYEGNKFFLTAFWMHLPWDILFRGALLLVQQLQYISSFVFYTLF